ncbi:vesicle-associated protein 1-1-like [Iris pallida]|uniref:Vesicle-associated protein 1-1-like n=1 Tax=Iris pallida TaxID=29817 RepID=A0AAX6DVW6_IRIPA|nr:vesicle-associated protein 1-1-like [Iris pallida]
MSTGELLGIDPLELKFPFELKKQVSCSIQLSNKSDDYVAFKVKTTSPKKYCVRPNTGVVLPRSTCDVIVTMQAQREMPPDMQCKDKFLVQSAVVSPGVTAKDITPEMDLRYTSTDTTRHGHGDTLIRTWHIFGRVLLHLGVSVSCLNVFDLTFTKDSGNTVEEVKLRVLYVSPASTSLTGSGGI